MAGRRDIEAGSAYLHVYMKQTALDRGIRDLQRKLKSFGRTATDIGKSLTAMSASIIAPLAASVKAASDMEETMNKFNVVFGENAVAVKKWADTYASEVGRSKQQIADFMASSQDLFMPLGFDAEQARGFSETLTKLAVDLASFNNKADADVLRDLQAALTGSGETMKKYGVVVDEAAVKQELFNTSIDPKTATNAQKAQARLAIILRGTTAAQGDAVRSAGSFANQMKALRANVMDSAVAIGGVLLPVVTPLVTDLTDLALIVGKWVKENESLVLTISKVAVGVGAAGVGLWALGSAAAAAATGIGALTVAATVLAAHPAVATIGALTIGLTALGYAANKSAFDTLRLAEAQGGLLDKGDKLRIQDQKRLDRLRELSEKQNLTNQEIEDAAGIIERLEIVYGDLGLEMDRTTGKITGAADAFDKLGEAMGRSAEKQIRLALTEANTNVLLLGEQLKEIQDQWWVPGRQQSYNEVLREQQKEAAKAAALFDRLEVLKAGDKGAVTGGVSATAAGIPTIPTGSTSTAIVPTIPTGSTSTAIVPTIPTGSTSTAGRDGRNDVGALTIGLTALGYAANKSAFDTLRLAEAQGGLLDKGDKLRIQDQKRLDRLRELSEKQNLTNQEIEDAAGIIERLEIVYGDLGLEMDRTTGRITGAADAFDKLGEAMGRSAEKQIRLALAEANKNVLLLWEQLKEIQDQWWVPGRQQSYNEVLREQQKEAAKAAALFDRLEVLKAGDKGAVTGGVSATAAGIPTIPTGSTSTAIVPTVAAGSIDPEAQAAGLLRWLGVSPRDPFAASGATSGKAGGYLPASIAGLLGRNRGLAVQAAGMAASPRGTFSGYALAAMGGGQNLAERTAKGIESLVTLFGNMTDLTEDELTLLKQALPRFS